MTLKPLSKEKNEALGKEAAGAIVIAEKKNVKKKKHRQLILRVCMFDLRLFTLLF